MNINTKKRLAFSLLAKDNGSDDTTMWNVHPSYSGVSLKWDKESGERYYTQSIDGTFTFNGSEADIITGRSLYTEFTLVIFDLDNGGNEVSRGTFRLTDCEIDIDHRSVKVKITANNPYKKLANKRDDEYNVVDLGLEKHNVNLWNYPIMQLYAVGDSVITVFNRNTFLQADVTPVDTIRYGTNELSYRLYMREGGDGFARVPEGHNNVSGDYMLTTYAGNIVRLTHTSNASKIEITPLDLSDPNSLWSAKIYDPSGTMYAYSFNHPFSDFSVHQNILFMGGAAPSGFTMYVKMMVWRLGTRMLTNVDLGEDTSTNQYGYISKDDIYPSNKVCARTISIYPTEVSTNTSATDTGYGRVPNTDLYYDKPDQNETWLPVYKESWFEGVSLWAKMVFMSQSDINTYKKEYEVQDFYSLGDVIKAVLGKIDESILFEPDAVHSRFLFDTINPVTQQQQGNLLVSQKSNILNLQYDYPAWKAPVKMSQILTFLRYAFNCYYHIDENNHFHIEHVLYYMNGGSYSTEQRGTVDLTMWRDCGNKQKLSFLTNRWSYETDSSKQASRIEFGWMDSQSELFNGWPIIVPTAYLIYTDERKDERRVDWFSTDIDFLTSVPAECSSDGFAVVRLSLTDADFVEEGQYTLNGVTYTTQNVSLSFPVLHQNFMLYDLWSEYVTINNSDNLVAVRKRSPVRTAEVGFIKLNTMSVDNPNIIVKTDAGNGEVESMSVDLTDMKVTTTLKYEI